MPRYQLIIEYDGSDYCGWQRQADAPSVQGELESAIEAFSGETPIVQGAGRTDAGVHARHQVAHIDLARDWDPFKIASATNAHLRDHRIAILGAKKVEDTFHARFSAVERHYLYRIIVRRAPLAIDDRRAWNAKVPLDATAMNEAAQILIGKHDFTTFRSSECQAESPIKTLNRLQVSLLKVDDHQQWIDIRVSARSFLHNQVRSLAGSLKMVGEGKWTTADLRTALDARDRKACGPVAPAHGLYLIGVDY